MRNIFTDSDLSKDGAKNDLPPTMANMPFIWSRTSKVSEVWDIVRAIRLWPHVAITTDSNGLCFSVTGNSMGHLNWDGRLDLPFGPEAADELMVVETDNARPDRTVFRVRTDADVDSAVRLLRLAYLIVDPKSPRRCG
jgi:hypothetical protein